MAESIKVTIAGREFSLFGEDAAIVKNAAELVNQQIKDLKKSYEHEPVSTLSVLAALNIAEKHFVNRHQNEIDRNYIVSEIEKMSEYLKSNLQ